MEFANQTETTNSTQNNDQLDYGIYKKNIMKKIKEENITRDLEPLLNTKGIKITQYKVANGEYVIKVNTHTNPIYFHFDTKFSTIVKCINTEIKLIPKIMRRDEDGFETFLEGWVGNVLLDDIKNIVFVTHIGVLYHQDEILNKEIKDEVIKFIDYYPQFNQSICNMNFIQAVNTCVESTGDINVKSVITNVEKLSYNIYQIDIFGFTEELDEESMEINCEQDTHDTYKVRVVFDKNTNVVKIKSDIGHNFIEDCSTDRFYYVNPYGEKFNTQHVPIIKSSKSESKFDLVQLIDYVFNTKPMIEINFSNII